MQSCTGLLSCSFMVQFCSVCWRGWGELECACVYLRTCGCGGQRFATGVCFVCSPLRQNFSLEEEPSNLASLGSQLAPGILLIPSTRLRGSCRAYCGPHTYLVSSTEHLLNPCFRSLRLIHVAALSAFSVKRISVS